ncbi:MAG TPA: chemotaxis protein CheB [Terriglobales bacterium]|nr:chemotaxis protein CheB [Terriglobales bacterium]
MCSFGAHHLIACHHPTLWKDELLPRRDIVVIGGSLGAIRALQELVRELPSDFSAPIFVVVHIPSDVPSLLHQLLARSGGIPAIQPFDGDPIEAGHIYVAPPDHHLTIEPGVVRVLRGPRENRHRPAIDPLFRTAARTYGSRVVGVILSGRLDDGSAGLLAVKGRGGMTVVQDPDEADSPEMPARAIQYVRPDYVLPSRAIGQKLTSLTQESDRLVMAGKKSARSETGNNSEDNLHAAYADEGEGTPSVFACPECSGVLWELKDHELVRFRCRVGHSYTMDSLHQEFSQSTEAALWAAMRALEEKSAMNRRIAEGSQTNESLAKRFLDQAQSDDASAKVIREIIFKNSGQPKVEETREKTGT